MDTSEKKINELVANNPKGLVARAFDFAQKVHSDQRRKTGEPYFKHVLETAETLKNWKLDEVTVAAGLLHDSIEDAGVSLDTLRAEFGEEVSFIVDGVSKISRVKYRGVKSKAENMRKLILALAQDLRVIFVRLADRLHNMRTLFALPTQKQKRIALETLEIYAPLAYRLGMQQVSGELQDLAFPYLFPDEYRRLNELIPAKYEERLNYLEKIKPEIETALTIHGMDSFEINFRAKRYSSIYRKLVNHNWDIDQIYDLAAVRVIVNTVADCYAVLGIIHEKWPPLPGRIKDYIAMPKPNGYKSLHTTVIGPQGKIVEFQIRTREMHEENELGIAAHWLYQQAKIGEKVSPRQLTKEIKWVQQMRDWQETFRHESGAADFIQAMKIDFLKDRIFVVTPAGDVIDLPAGSTPIDFAYHIHSEIGNSAIGARVNGKIARLDSELKSGDMVEILTQKNKKPSEKWLKFVKTAMARHYIKSALKLKNKILENK
jgi:GTP pyrophosphokinase